MELRQLRYFVAIAEEGGFSRAAQRLHISQPPLSTQIKSLEEEIGATLLARTNRGVSLTGPGQIFYDEARVILSRVDGLRAKTLQADRGDVGVLSVGFVSIAAFGILPPALKTFSRQFPLVQVQLHELTTDVQIRELRAARLDLGLGLAPVEEADLLFRRVLREELVLAVPADHAAVAGETIDLRSVSKESFIVPPRDIAPGLYDLTISRCRAAGFAPRIVQNARQMQTVIGLVSCGMGLALVPASVRNLQRTGVRYLPLRGKPSRIELGIVSLRESGHALGAQFVHALLLAARATQR